MTGSSCLYFSLKIVILIIQTLEDVHYKVGKNRSCKIHFLQKADKLINYLNNFNNIGICEDRI